MAAPTQDDLNRLNAALVAGERQVTIGGTSITYQTIDSMMKARDDLQRQLVNTPSLDAPTRPRRSRVCYGGRGY